MLMNLKIFACEVKKTFSTFNCKTDVKDYGGRGGPGKLSHGEFLRMLVCSSSGFTLVSNTFNPS